MSAVTIVMYHYVRPLARTAYPRLTGLDLAKFEGQLDYLTAHYHVVSLAEVIAAVQEKRSLPERAAVLTFDDGYADHYHHALPALRRRGLGGAFFPPTEALIERRVLDVNKIHFILAATTDRQPLVQMVEAAVMGAGDEFDLAGLDEYRRRYWQANRFDDAETIYIKRMLQTALPQALRARITDELFRRHVSADERSFADDLYLSTDQLVEMAGQGMEIGSHGHTHRWLNSLSADEQAQDIDRSLDILAGLGVLGPAKLFCYPYGAYDAETLKLLSARGCAAAVTTNFAIARPKVENMLELSRLDTNDFPYSAHA